ncbi:MAG: DUF2285 domain-containing protein [Alphaproteobacteria bacterium]|nr:DUF2285 domain-containing protein [Alphaproteobacteria bacterium]
MSRPDPVSVADLAPSEASVTDYDRAHAAKYLRLLDAAMEGASWEEACRIVLGIDPDREPERAASAHQSHLERARWLTEHGYRDLLKGS